MKLLSKIIILLLSILLAILIILPALIEPKSIKIDIQNKLTAKFQTNFKIESDVDIHFFPRPKITINDAKIDNYEIDDGYIDITFDSIDIVPSFLSLFDSIAIKKIVFNQVNVDYIIFYEKDQEALKTELIQIPQLNQDFIANKIFDFNSNQDVFNLAKIEDIILSNSNITIKNINGEIYSKYNDFNAKIYSNLTNGRVFCKGSFVSDDIPTIFDLDISTDQDDISKLTINSPILQGDISGKFFDSQTLSLTQSNFDGKINLSISNLKLLLDKYFSQKSLIFKNINNTENIKVLANIFLKDGIINIEQIKIESDIINGSGEIIIDSSNDKKSLESKIAIDYLNFDDLWIGKLESIKEKYLNDAVTAIIDNFNNSKNINHDRFPKLDISVFGLLPKADITIKELRFNDHLLNDISILMSSHNKNQILLEKFDVNMGEESKLQINGIIENIGSLIKLDGQVNLNSINLHKIMNLVEISTIGLKKDSLKDFQLRSKILLLPNTTILKDVKAVLNKSSVISGESSIIKNDDILNVDYNYNFNQFKIDRYFSDTYFNRFTSGKSFLENFIALNKNDTNHKISLKFNQLSYKDFFLTNQVIEGTIGRGVIDIPALLINKSGDNSNIKFYLDVYSPIPVLNLSINSDYIEINDLKERQKSDKFQSSFLNYFFEFPSLSGFDGNINIDIDNLNINNLMASNIIIELPFKEGVAKIKKMHATIFGGQIDIVGDLVLGKQKRFSNSFKLLNIENQKFFNNLFNIKNIDSKSNITGLITSYGQNRGEFLKNLNLQSNFNSSSVTMKKFGIGDLLRRMNKNPTSIEDIQKITFSDSAKTFFKTITGNINIKPNNKKKDFYISTESLGLNSVANGQIDLKNNKINMGYNAVMIVVNSARKAIPLRFAINAAGPIDNLSLSPNFSQIKQYLKIK
ncbi:AsmA family protein [Rickettsiales bacterium]|nr:AsmA family protein [Rickettsiales bacterium]MDB2550714.1 AsmA family protein [Rickettsiales bacterium]